MKKFFILLTFSAFFQVSYALTITPDIEPGQYPHSLRIQLKSDEDNARIYYGFNPDGWPQDLFEYTGSPIEITQSTPLVFFGFTDLENESDIYIEDYTLHFPTHVNISLEENGEIGIKNTGDSAINIGDWWINTLDCKEFFPYGITLKPGQIIYSPCKITSSSPVSIITPEKSILLQEEITFEPTSSIFQASVISTKKDLNNISLFLSIFGITIFLFIIRKYEDRKQKYKK